MRKKHLQLLLTAVLAGTTVSTMAAGLTVPVQAEGNDTNDDNTQDAVASIGETSYSTLEEALNAVEDSEETTIQLLKDASPKSGNYYFLVEANKKIILDLNGRNISNNDYCALYVQNGGHLTITDTAGNGSITATPAQAEGYAIFNRGQLTINGGTIAGGSEKKGYSVFTANDDGNTLDNIKTTIVSGTLKGLCTNGNDKNVEIEVQGGEFNTLSYLPAQGTYTIRGGTFKCTETADGWNKACLAVKAGTLNIEGGTFEYQQTSEQQNSNSTSTNNNGPDDFYGAIVISKPTGANAETAYADDLTVTISGGSFTTNKGDAIVVANYASEETGTAINLNISNADVTGDVDYYTPDDPTSKTTTVAITGGSFTSNPLASETLESVLTDSENTPVASTGSEESKTFYVGPARISRAMNSAASQTEFTITQGDLNLSGVKAGITIKNEGEGTVKVNGHTINEGSEMTTTTPSTSGGSSGSSGGSSSVDKVTSVSMHRLYNPNSGEHFYTKEAAEKNHLVSLGWQAEGVGWTAPSTSTQPVYRLYNPNAGDHHYTMNAAEQKHLISLGWKDEGIGWYSDEAKTIPLYREYNPNAKAGSHNYTTSQAEHNHLISVGWNDEGIAWYGVN